MGDRLSAARREELLAVVAVLVATAVALGLRMDAEGRLAHLDDAVYDLGQRGLVEAPAVHPDVTVVLVDDESLTRLGDRWPMERRVWARFLDVVAGHAPRAVLVDAWFETPAPRGEVELALDIADAIRDGDLGDVEAGEALADALDRKAAKLDGDRALARALAGLGRVVLGVMCAAPQHDVHARAEPPNMRSIGSTPPASALRCAHIVGSVPRLANAARGQASITLTLDPDGVARRYPYFLARRGQLYPSLALAAVQLAEPDAFESMVQRAGAADGGRPGLPLPRRDAFRTLRFSDVLEAAESASLKDAFEDRIVFVGVSAAGTKDYVHTARDIDQPGVFLHAAATSALLAGRFLLHDGPALRWGAGGGFGLLLLVALVGLRVERTSVVVLLGACGAIAWGVVVRQAMVAGHVVPAWPVWGGFAGWLAVRLASGFRRAAEARKQAASIRRAFHHYLAPAVVEALMADPTRLVLGGERREITAFFSDIKGFTSLSEALPPAALVQLLNECLGRMSEVILEEGGIIDKYIGDAIVAMFGAPMEQPDHAARACRAALRCHDVMAELRAEWAARELPEVHMRIGLNTGYALVGNMGSEKRFDYTMIGDTVNLAARLEGANGQYGTWMMCSEATARAAGDAAAFRELDLIRPKGKSVAVRVYEIVDPAAAGAEARRSTHARHAEALALYRGQRWEEALQAFRALHGEGDAPAETFVKRIEIYRARPPLEQWDGVFTMTTK